MSCFMLLTMIVQTLYGLIDIFWVGHLGRDAVASVALGSNLMLALMAVAQTLAVGAAALISQAAGRKDMDEARRLFTQSQAPTSTLISGFAGAGDSHTANHAARTQRSEEHTSELQSLMRTPYAVFCLKNNNM